MPHAPHHRPHHFPLLNSHSRMQVRAFLTYPVAVNFNSVSLDHPAPNKQANNKQIKNPKYTTKKSLIVFIVRERRKWKARADLQHTSSGSDPWITPTLIPILKWPREHIERQRLVIQVSKVDSEKVINNCSAKGNTKENHNSFSTL